VSDSDVESYKQIKFDLDELRLLVEKSELWVYKSKGQGKADKKKADDVVSAEVMSLMMTVMLLFTLRLCSFTGEQTCASS